MQKNNSNLKFIIVFIVLLGIVASVIAIQLGFNPFVNADPALIPEQILITNQGPNSVTISFMTFARKGNSLIKYGVSADQMNSYSYDVNNIANSATYESNIHYHILSGLTAGTTYYYTISVNGQIENNNGVPFQFDTAQSEEAPQTPNTIYGKIFGGTECIVNTHAINDKSLSTALSEFLSLNGTYTIDVNEFKDRQSLEAFPQDSNTQILVFVTCGDNKRGAIISELLNNLPDITVTDSYPIAQYSTTLTGLVGTSTTPTAMPTGTIRTPTPTPTRTAAASIQPTIPATIKITVTPTPSSISPSITTLPTPTSILPKSGIKEDLPIYSGIILVIFGFGLIAYIRKHSYS